MSAEVDIAVIGAGVIGLAIAAELAQQEKGVFVFEKNHSYGLETSSRNSGVIHAGLYYPEDSLKARFCIDGKHLLYELCTKYGIGHKKLGKLIIAVDESELQELERIHDQGTKNGVDDLRLLSRREFKRLEPNIEGVAALLSPSTGIIEPYSLCTFFYNQARRKGAKFVFNSEVVGIEYTGKKYEVQINDREGTSSFTARIVINAAGLHCDKIAQLAGIDIAQAGYKLHYCKGEYFSLNSEKKRPVSMLVYPVPRQAGLGIHLTPDIEGRIRLGPSDHYVDDIDYRVDETQKELFYNSVKRFLPQLNFNDMEPEMAGIRPKLQAPANTFADFVISHESEKGLPGLINLIGIESPGLTASPAIARYAADMVRKLHC